MIAIFSEFLGDSLEVFMDDFSIFGNNFKIYLAYLTKILEVCIRKRLVLSWEKSHFMAREGVVLGHIVSGKRIEVDKAKKEVIDESFSCVVKTQRRWSKKIYKTELTKTRYNNQVSGRSTESRVDFNRRVDLVELRFKRGFT